MKQRAAITESYNKTSAQYATAFFNELKGKSLDRLLLKRFALENVQKGKILDIACGPGQTTQFLQKCGVIDLLGVDLSIGMVTEAKELSENTIEFQVENMLQFSFEDNTIGSAICFYGIVHFTYKDLELALTEIKRVIRPSGQFLFCFHIGDEVIAVAEFLGAAVQMDYYYFEVDRVLELLKKVGWKVLEVIERHPYETVEYPSKRGYILVEK